jgi:hypothetical protein
VLGLQQRSRSRHEEVLAEVGASQHREHFQIVPRKLGGAWLDPRYEVHTCVGHRLGVPIERRLLSFEPPQVGSLAWLQLAPTDDEPCQVRILAVHDCRQLTLEEAETRGLFPDAADQAPWSARLLVQACTEEYQVDGYEALSDLVPRHPDLDPRVLFDATVPHGTFVGTFHQVPWRQRDGRYWLELDDLEEHTFSSLVITAEAIRAQAWNLLCYDGARHVERFLTDVPVARQAHDRAVAAWWLSSYARQQRLTHTALLRLGLELWRPVVGTVEEEADRCVSLVEQEGFGYGRYLLVGDRCAPAGPTSFTPEERAALRAEIVAGRGCTPWLAAYVAEVQQRVQAQVLPHEVDDVPF